MSGRCGLFGRFFGTVSAGFAHAPETPLAAMAQAVAPGMPLRCAVHPLGAAALAAGSDAHADASMVHEDGLLVLCWGPQARTLANLWRGLGAQACAALPGHFAFALFDARAGEGLLAVDRCASRPLFFQEVARSLVFASSMEGLARYPGSGQALDPQAVFDYLYLDGASGPRPLLAGQQRLGPGEYLHLRGGRVERASYWRMRYPAHGADTGPRALLDALAGALPVSAAVSGSESESKAQAQTGKGAGLLFAGGPASTLLGASLRHTGLALHTYALGFGTADRGALARAAAVARRLGSRHRARMLGPSDVVAAVPLLAAHAGEPCGDPAAVALLFAARLARDDGLVGLYTCLGGAQLFGLNRRQRGMRAGLGERLTAALLCGLAARLPGQAATALRLGERIDRASAPALLRLRRANHLLAHGPACVFEPGFLLEVDSGLAAAGQDQTWWRTGSRSALNRTIELALHGDLPHRVLPALRAACAAADLAPLLPFLDDAVIGLSARLPARRKDEAARALARAALRTAGAGTVRAHAAPVLPFGRWLREDPGMRALACDSLSDLNRRHILRRDFIAVLLGRRLLDDAEAAGRTIWQLMMLEQWLARRDRPTAALAPEAAAACVAAPLAA